MRRTHLGLVMVATIASSPASASDRLTDRDVKALVERINDGRDRFESALDGRLKDSVIRGPSGEVSVAHFLDDFQENINRLKDRLKPEYAASTEVATILRQASSIDGFFRQHPLGTRGESEWNRLATDLKALAGAYGTDFPLPQNAAVRRIGDRELAGVVAEIAGGADRLKKSLDADLKKDPTIDKATRQTMTGEADQLLKDAKALRERINDGEPSSAETDRLLARATRVQSIVDSHKLPASASIWSGMASRLQTVAGAYGDSWPGTR